MFTQSVAESLDSRGQGNVIYTDFQKAFDQLDHYVLLPKLDSFVVSDLLLALFKSYLTDRFQVVQYGGYTSRSFIPTSGVPQGSNLEPLLFLIFINDLPMVIDTPKLLFADDLKIYSEIRSVLDAEVLQRQLDKLSEWC